MIGMGAVNTDQDQGMTKLYAGVIDHLPWGICVVDREGRIVLMNRFQERLSAVRRTDVIGRCLYDSPGVRASGLDKAVRQVLASGRPWRGPIIELAGERSEGEPEQAFRDEVLPIRSQDRVVGALILSIPAAEEAKLQKERDQVRLRLQSVLEALPAPVMVVDADFGIVRLNSAYARLFTSRPAEELIGQRCYAVLRGHAEMCEDCPVPEALRSGKWVRSELKRGDESSAPKVAVSALALLDRGQVMLVGEEPRTEGRQEGVLSASQREALQREIALQVARMRARAAYAEGVLNHTEEMVAVLSEEGWVLFANRAFADFVQRAPDQLTGCQFLSLSGTQPVAHLQVTFQEALASETAVQGELTWQASPREERHVEYRWTPFVLADGSKVIALCARDVTERVRSRERQAFQEKMASLAVLAGRVAHEINNPLEALQNHVSLLEMEIARGGDVAGVRAELEAIQKQIRQIAGVTSFLLGFTKSSPEEYGPVDVATVLRNATAVSEITRASADITVQTNIAPNLPRVRGSESDLERCFVNILRNAAEAIVDKGVVRIVASHNAQTGNVQIEISDTGVGIPEQLLPHIFEPFFTTKKVSRQAGLGLSLCYGIISDHGGHIEVKSQHGRGTTVTISLPAVVMEPQSIGARA